MADFVYQEGTLASATPFVVNVGGKYPPMVATLQSADVTRKIELSWDGGVNYITPTYDGNIVAMCNVAIMAPCSHVRFTGVAGDKWNIR